jgi:hypothetical protein
MNDLTTVKIELKDESGSVYSISHYPAGKCLHAALFKLEVGSVLLDCSGFFLDSNDSRGLTIYTRLPSDWVRSIWSNGETSWIPQTHCRVQIESERIRMIMKETANKTNLRFVGHDYEGRMVYTDEQGQLYKDAGFSEICPDELLYVKVDNFFGDTESPDAVKTAASLFNIIDTSAEKQAVIESRKVLKYTVCNHCGRFGKRTTTKECKKVDLGCECKRGLIEHFDIEFERDLRYVEINNDILEGTLIARLTELACSYGDDSTADGSNVLLNWLCAKGTGAN